MCLQNETIEVLCNLLNQGDEVDRCYAARTLGVLRSESAVDVLIEKLKDEDVDVCVDAANALGSIGSNKAVPALIESLERDNSGEICSAVAGALSHIASPDAIAALIKVLSERPEGLEWDDDWDTWWDVQMEAVRGLGATKAESSVETLCTFLDDESQQDIESEVVNTLVNIPGLGFEKVLAFLSDKEVSVRRRRRAAKALGCCTTTPAAVKALGQALKDSEEEVRAAALTALAELKAVNYIQAMVLMLRDPSPLVRDAALKSISQLDPDVSDAQELEATLYDMLSDPDSVVRATLLHCLRPFVAKKGLDEQHLEVVSEILNDKAAETASAACILLGESDSEQALPPLLDFAANSSAHAMARREAIHAISHINHSSADIISVLSVAAYDEQQPVRLAALSTLMQLDCVDGQDAEDENFMRPLDIVIGVLKGKSEEIQEASENLIVKDASPAQVEEKVLHFVPDARKQFENSAAEQELEMPQEVQDAIQLPETPATIVEAGDVQEAASTLSAIAMDNVDAMLVADQDESDVEHDQDTLAYLDIVEENKETIRRIRRNRKQSPEQDVRRLAARALSSSDSDEALIALLVALNDDDKLVRKEAIESIGTIAARDRSRSLLSDATGSLITQIALGDIEVRVSSARTLAYMGNRIAIIPLLEQLHTTEMTMRVQAIESLTLLATDSLDPTIAGHMVPREVSPLSIARKISKMLEDTEMGVRVAATKSLAEISKTFDEKAFTGSLVEKVAASVSIGTGEEARLVGKAMRKFSRSLSNQALLNELNNAENSTKRSVYVEMIEELLNPDQGQPYQLA